MSVTHCSVSYSKAGFTSWFPNPVWCVSSTVCVWNTCVLILTQYVRKALVRPLPGHTSHEPLPQSLVWRVVGKMVLTLLTLQRFFFPAAATSDSNYVGKQAWRAQRASQHFRVLGEVEMEPQSLIPRTVPCWIPLLLCLHRVFTVL